MDVIQISVVVLVLAAVVAGVVWLQASEAAAATRRRETMMKRIGFDPKWVSLDDPQTRTAGQVVRRQCAKCTRDASCELWLAGELLGSNAFCPNAETFKKLSEVHATEKAA